MIHYIMDKVTVASYIQNNLKIKTNKSLNVVYRNVEVMYAICVIENKVRI